MPRGEGLTGLLAEGEEVRVAARLEHLGLRLWHPALEKPGADGMPSILSPLIMGACRMPTYVTAAFAAGGITGVLWDRAAGLFRHVVGLIYAAKQEAYDRIGAAWPFAVMAVLLGIAAIAPLGLWAVARRLIAGQRFAGIGPARETSPRDG